jgi:hypothetical protein
MTKRKAVKTQKHALDNPGDISISVAPAPAKKVNKGPKAKANAQVETPSPPTGAPVTVSSATTAKLHPRPKPKGPAPTPDNEPTPVVPTVTAPPVPTAKSSKRNKKPSEIAQKGMYKPDYLLYVRTRFTNNLLFTSPGPGGKQCVCVLCIVYTLTYHATEQQIKDKKLKKQAQREQAAVIEETPEETAAFVERMRAAQPTPTASISVSAHYLCLNSLLTIFRPL